MTMDESVKEIQHISTKIHKDNEIVCYSQISEDLGVSYRRAQALLYNFYKANKQQLNASFVIIGIKQGQRTIKFVELEPLVDSELNKFDSIISVTVYAISLNTFTYTTQDLVISQLKRPVDLNKLDYYEKLGMIKGPELKRDANLSTNKPSPSTISTLPTTSKPESKHESKHESKPEPTKKTSLSSHYVSRKQQKPSQKPQETRGPKRTVVDSPKYEYKSRKLENKRDKVVMENTPKQEEGEDDFDDDMDLDAPKTPKDYKTKLNAMFEGDSDGDEQEKNQEERKEPIITEDHDQMEVDEPEQEPEPEPEQEQEPVSETQQPEGQGVSEEEEKQTNEPEYDEDGYLITRAPKSKTAKPKPSKSSAATESKSNSTPKPKTTTTTKGSDKTKSGKKQTSLMNFFGKKK